MTKATTVRRIDDLHAHFRIGPLLRCVLPFTAQYAGRAIAMPNTRPRAILTAGDVIWYRNEIMDVVNSMASRPSFEPLMTIEVRDATTPDMIVEAYRAGAVAGKVYPLGMTTNSDEGLRDFGSPQIMEVFAAMEEVGMRLLLHGELGGERVLVTKRENNFLPELNQIAYAFPRLKIVLEHVSSVEGVRLVRWRWEAMSPRQSRHITCASRSMM